MHLQEHVQAFRIGGTDGREGYERRAYRPSHELWENEWEQGSGGRGAIIAFAFVFLSTLGALAVGGGRDARRRREERVRTSTQELRFAMTGPGRA